MLTELPECARLDILAFLRFRIEVLILVRLGRNVQPDVVFAEAGQRDVEAGIPEPDQFRAHDVLIPGGLLRQLIVGEDVCYALLFGQVIREDARQFRHPGELRGFHAAVTAEDAVLAVDQQRPKEAKLQNTPAQFLDLLRAVDPGVILVWNQVGNLPNMYLCRHPDVRHRSDSPPAV